MRNTYDEEGTDGTFKLITNSDLYSFNAFENAVRTSIATEPHTLLNNADYVGAF